MRALPPAALLAAACQAAGSPRPQVIELVANGEVIVRVARDPGGACTIDPPGVIARTAGESTTAGAWSVGPGVAGRELRGAGGVIARVVDETGPPHRVSVLDAVGVPLFRMTDAPRGAELSDGARRPIASLTLAGDRVQVAGDGLAPAEVIGTRDLALAAVLAVAHVPPIAAAVYACDRLSTPAK